MSVRPEDAVRQLRARFEHPAPEDRAAATRATDVLPQLAAILRTAGAARIVLFGSLALGTFRAGSDIDLAVSGLMERDLARRERELTSLAGVAVELINLDIASAGIRQHIEHFGRDL